MRKTIIAAAVATVAIHTDSGRLAMILDISGRATDQRGLLQENSKMLASSFVAEDTSSSLRIVISARTHDLPPKAIG